jgi:hypothetical protein
MKQGQMARPCFILAFFRSDLKVAIKEQFACSSVYRASSETPRRTRVVFFPQADCYWSFARRFRSSCSCWRMCVR